MKRPPSASVPALDAQIRLQLRVWRQRMTWWIPLIFLAGLAVSLIGLFASATELAERGVTAGFVVFAVFVLFFGAVCFQWLMAPLLLRPRVVPYFKRPLGEYGGGTTAAFRGGRALYREMATLDELAGTRGVAPLSAFGFAYDHYDQPVDWHGAAQGLATVDAVLGALAATPEAASDLLADLEALASVLRTALDQATDFSLVVRLHAKESMQGVMTRETRQGSFW
jgi:hypothetical protein